MRHIVIAPYDSAWPFEFEEIAAPLRSAFGELALGIDHIGSTAIPGLAANDIIDLQITVVDLDRNAVQAAVAPLGYSFHPEIASDHVPPGGPTDAAEWTKLYLQAPDRQRATHVHIRQAGRANQRYPLVFRDYLRSSTAATRAYSLIKHALARLHPDEIEAYYDIKDPVCDLIIESAERWARAVGWVQGRSDD